MKGNKYYNPKINKIDFKKLKLEKDFEFTKMRYNSDVLFVEFTDSMIQKVVNEICIKYNNRISLVMNKNNIGEYEVILKVDPWNYELKIDFTSDNLFIEAILRDFMNNYYAIIGGYINEIY